MLSVHDIRTVSFSKPALGRRGYAEDEVDAFIDRVAGTVEELLLTQAESTLSEGALSEAVTEQFTATPSVMSMDTTGGYAPGGYVQGPASHVIFSAHEPPVVTAPVGEPQEFGRAREPEPPAASVSSEAAARVLALADEVATRVQSEATVKAEQVVADAQAHALRVLSDATGEASRIVESAKAEVAGLDDRIRQLRVFEQAYRVKVRDFMSGQLSDLQGL